MNVPTSRMGLKEQKVTGPEPVLGVCHITGSLEPGMEPEGTRGSQPQGNVNTKVKGTRSGLPPNRLTR